MELNIEDLKQSNLFLNNLYENVTSAIFLADINARIRSFNNIFSILFEKDKSQIIGKMLVGQLNGGIQFFNSHGTNVELTFNIKDISGSLKGAI